MGAAALNTAAASRAAVPVPRGPAGRGDPGQRSTRIGSLLKNCQYKHEKNFMLFFSRQINHEFYAWDT
jgi:hypothetical protein